MNKQQRILSFLRELKSSFVGAEQVFTQGSCFKLYKVMKTVFPGASPFLYKDQHIYIEIEGEFYDINGLYTDKKHLFENGHFITKNEQRPDDWIFNIYDIHVECPRCGEPFFRGELEPEEIEKTKSRYE